MYTVLGKKYNDLKVVESVACFSYKMNFEPIGYLTSDIGWGCTYRCGQMLIKEFLKRINSKVSLVDFNDGYNYMFSIHNMSIIVHDIYNDIPGTWLGACSVSFTLKKLLEKCENTSVIVARDSIIYNDKVKEVKYPILFLIPISPSGLFTLDFLKNILDFRLCNGIIGGKPRSSYYIIGYENDDLLYLDPHIIGQDDDKKLYKIKREKLDPSLLISFVCENQVEYEMLKYFIEKLEPKGIITIQDKELDFDNEILTF
jgi:cysteine protease ATG4